jgi:hypothetical protein
MIKRLYLVQPYLVGSKQGRSLVLTIPSEVAKHCNLDTSTIFFMRIDAQTKTIILRAMNETAQGQYEKVIPTGESFQTADQQVSPEVP